MTRVPVTGGAGYIGAHTCKVLAQAGHEPIVYDNLLHGDRHAALWGPLAEGNILDRAHGPGWQPRFAAPDEIIRTPRNRRGKLHSRTRQGLRA